MIFDIINVYRGRKARKKSGEGRPKTERKNPMSDKNNGWKRPEEKYVETELEDNFEAFFSAEEVPEVPEGKRRRKNRSTPEEQGPDILAVSDAPEDSGFVITKVVSVEGGEAAPKAKAPEQPAPESVTGAAPAAAEAAAPAAEAAVQPAQPAGAARADAPAEGKGGAENGKATEETSAEAELPGTESVKAERAPEETSAGDAKEHHKAGKGKKKAGNEKSAETLSLEGQEEETEAPAAGDGNAALSGGAVLSAAFGQEESCPDKEFGSGEAGPEEDVVVDLSENGEKASGKAKKFRFFPRAKKIINQKRKHRYVATIGAVLIVLAIIGSVSVISTLVSFTGRLVENASQKEKFEWKIYPLLMLDPASFEEPSQLDGVFLLKTALWSTLLENRSAYSYNENGLLVVPASDLDVAAKKLYGDSVTLEHQTFSEGYEFFYVYDEETNSYSVPISGQTAGYTPKVVKITKNGDIYTLIVGYVAPTTLWNVSEDGVSGEPVPDKYLYYDLQKVGGGDYIIKAVRAIPADDLPEDLEVADYQQINQTQYFDYEQQYQDYLAGLQEEQAAGGGAQGENTSGDSSEGTSSEVASGAEE